MLSKSVVWHFFLFLFFTIAVTGFYYIRQPQIEVGDGKGWDGKSYYAMYENFRDGGNREVEYPFCKRVGTPYLASLISGDAKTGFLIVNVIGGIIAACAMFLAVSYKTKKIYVAWFFVLPLLFYLFSGIRFSYYHPYTVDPLATALLALSVLLYVHKKYVPVVLLLLFSALFRETGLYYGLLFVVIISIDLYVIKKYFLIWIISSLYILAIIMNFSFLHYFTVCQGSQLLIAINWFKARVLNPFEMIKFIAALSMVIGPFMYRFKINDVKSYNPFIIFFALSLLMSLSGGYDMTRIFYISYPVYILLFAPHVLMYSKFELIVLSFAGLIVNRFLTVIPEPLNYMPNNDLKGYFAFFPEYADISISFGIIIYWGLIFFLLRVIKGTSNN